MPWRDAPDAHAVPDRAATSRARCSTSPSLVVKSGRGPAPGRRRCPGTAPAAAARTRRNSPPVIRAILVKTDHDLQQGTTSSPKTSRCSAFPVRPARRAAGSARLALPGRWHISTRSPSVSGHGAGRPAARPVTAITTVPRYRASHGSRTGPGRSWVKYRYWPSRTSTWPSRPCCGRGLSYSATSSRTPPGSAAGACGRRPLGELRRPSPIGLIATTAPRSAPRARAAAACAARRAA